MANSITPDELARYLAGELSEADHQRVYGWLHANPDVRLELEGIAGAVPDVEAAVRRLRETADRNRHLSWAKERSPLADSFETSKSRIGGLVESPRRTVDRRPVLPAANTRRPLRPVRLLAAATVLIVSLAALVVWIARQAPAPMTITAEAGERQTVELADGTTVTLNAASRLVVHPDFGERRRRVALEGEGYFAVEHDPNLPFIVDAGTATVTVLGTSFNVDGYAADRITVVVAEGLVRMQPASGPAADLTAGDRGRLLIESGRIAVDQTSIDEATAWVDRRLVFRGTPMEEVAARLEREYDRDVEIPRELVGRRLDATFEAEPIEEVALLIAGALDVDVSIEDERVRFSAREMRP